MSRKDALAVLGGDPVNDTAWPDSNTIGEEEKRAVMDVLDSGVLSGFRAAAGEDFLGGPSVRRLEEAWASYVGTRHAVAFNSLTSGLNAAVGAIGLEPGEEVIVSPFTMSASATCVLAYGGIPIFADIDPVTYCLDPASIEARLTPRTRAIVIVHLFGHPANMDAVMDLAERYGLTVIEDCAQAPAAIYRGRPVGTIGAIGGFSLNYHKTIHAGEGGLMVTNDDRLALRLRLIRNHGEAVVADMSVEDLPNLIGWNTRMTEIQAAIGFEQLQKLDWLTDRRLRLADYLDERLTDAPGVRPQKRLEPDSRHVYYFYPMRYDVDVWKIPRSNWVEAVRAEGIEMREAYGRPIYWEPHFERRIAFGSEGFPFRFPGREEIAEYPRGLCPEAEAAHEETLVFGKFCRWPLEEEHIDQVVAAIWKVFEHREALRAAVAT